MKKLLALLLALSMVFALAACGNKATTETSGEAGTESAATVDAFGEAKYGLNFESEDVQAMSDERATVEVLAETAKDWLGGATLHAYSSDKKTYEDFVAHIGCDPTEYQYDAKNGYRTFIWKAENDDTAWFSAFFLESDGAWELYTTSSANLGIM